MKHTLDEVMAVSSYWRDMVHDHGREVAELELMFEQLNIECEWIRRREQADLESLRIAMSAELGQHLAKRKCLREQPGCSLEKLKEFDANFMNEQTAKGHSIYKWLNQFGDTVAKEIDRIQSMEKLWADELLWRAEKKRLEKQAEIEQQRKILEADQRLAVLLGNELRGIVREVLLEVFSHGK